MFALTMTYFCCMKFASCVNLFFLVVRIIIIIIFIDGLQFKSDVITNLQTGPICSKSIINIYESK